MDDSLDEVAGTVVLDCAGTSGRRALSLVPDPHLCVVDAAQVVAGVSDAIAALAGAIATGRPLTLISGPSGPRTSSYAGSRASMARAPSR